MTLQWQLKIAMTVSDDTNLFIDTQLCVTIVLAFEWWNTVNAVNWQLIPIQSKLIWFESKCFDSNVCASLCMHACDIMTPQGQWQSHCVWTSTFIIVLQVSSVCQIILMSFWVSFKFNFIHQIASVHEKILTHQWHALKMIHGNLGFDGNNLHAVKLAWSKSNPNAAINTISLCVVTSFGTFMQCGRMAHDDTFWHVILCNFGWHQCHQEIQIWKMNWWQDP